MNLVREIDKARADVREAEHKKAETASRVQALVTERVEAEAESRTFGREKDLEGLIIENRSIDAVLKAKRDRVSELEKMAASAEAEAERTQHEEMWREAVDVSQKACELIKEIVSLRERFTTLGFSENGLVKKANNRRAVHGEPQLGCRIQCFAGAFPVMVAFFPDKIVEVLDKAAFQRNRILNP